MFEIGSDYGRVVAAEATNLRNARCAAETMIEDGDADSFEIRYGDKLIGTVKRGVGGGFVFMTSTAIARYETLEVSQ